MVMGFFNSLSVRTPLAVIGGFLYSLFTYEIVTLLDLPSQFATCCAIFVFLFYLGSRLLILFSGIDSAYYSIAFLITLIVDGSGGKPAGNIIQSIWNSFFSRF